MPPPAIRIRRARESDVPAIVALERESFIEPWDPETFLQTLEWCPTTFFIADQQGEVRGFLVGCLENTGTQVYGHISNLAVMPRHRREGIGEKLVRRAEHQFLMEGATGILLEVRFSNTGAQAFYRRLGYEEAVRIHAYYANGEDAILMMRDLLP